MGVVISLYGNEKPSKDVDKKSMESESYRVDIIRPALKITNLWSPAAEELVLGTHIVETRLKVVKQYGGGPALGFGQHEPATYHDDVKYLDLRRRDLRELILSACYLQTFPEASALMWNLRLGVLMTRIHYFRRPEPLPEAGDIMGMAQYWKSFYNSSKGAGTLNDYIGAWKECV